MSLQPLSQGLWLAFINGVIAQEFNYARYESDSWSNAFVLPVVDRGFINGELASDLLLLESQIQAPLPNVVSEPVEYCRADVLCGPIGT